MILSFINIRKVPREGFALGFQHFPRDLANVNEWKIMFDPSIVILLNSKSCKKCHKNFENRFINENLTPKNDLDLVFYMCNGGNPNILNLEFLQIW